MVLVAERGLIFGGWLTFLLVLFAILSAICVIWFLLYVEMSQRKNWKTIVVGIVISSLIVAFEIQLILLKSNVIF